jgi:cobalt-zinc-cadmium efflux system membrane fusion protein
MEAAQAALAVAQAEARRAATVARAAHVSGSGGSVAIVSPISGRITAQTATLAPMSNRRPNCSAWPAAMRSRSRLPWVRKTPRAAPGDQASILLPNGAVAGKVRAVTRH